VDSTASIGSLMEQYLPIKTDSNKNYVLVFWASTGCPYSNLQIENANYLYEKYKHMYRFIATTNEQQKTINKNHKKLKITAQYAFENYIGVWGLRSSIRNLETRNNALPKEDYVPILYVIRNDSIIHKHWSVGSKDALQKFEEYLTPIE
ncbi:MAG TPA: hypothetical protein PK715_11010, partial [Chitinophagales bacterium]|nr:hypothetical protein [Chitinophagales bacterium]